MQMVIEPLFRLLLLSSSDSERNLRDASSRHGAPKSCPFMCRLSCEISGKCENLYYVQYRVFRVVIGAPTSVESLQ